MLFVLWWYLAVTVLGLVAWPIAFSLLPSLPDRGYSMSKALGLLLTGFVFWLLCSLGFLNNTVGGILAAFLIVCVIAVVLLRKNHISISDITATAAEIRPAIITSELLFLVGLSGWALFRAYNPDLYGTEKPMELAFLNGVRQSQVFPPQDPWLSGYSISYYYFGYVIMAMLAEITNTPTGIAFNIGNALLLALILIGSYGIVFNLLSANGKRVNDSLQALFGPLFVAVIGNLEGLVELVRALKFPTLGASFWNWLDLEDLADAPTQVLWPPDEWRYWWWWRASRVIRDRDIAGTPIGLQPIDEFPFFSFLLGDMHPHVLSLPFVLLALALSLNALIQKEQLSWPQKFLYGVCFGGLAFLNTWDFPIYMFILACALTVKSIRDAERFELSVLVEPATTLVVIFVTGITAYIPWYISFSSQAGGILPNALFATRFHQFFVMFGPFIVLIGSFLIYQIVESGRAASWKISALVTLGVVVSLILVTTVAGLIGVNTEPEVASFVLSSTGAPDVSSALAMIGWYRLSHPILPVALALTLFATLALLIQSVRRPQEESGVTQPADNSGAFVFILILTGVLLALGPEFLYLKDGFGQRLNTVFKFYYAAWVLWAIASAYGVWIILTAVRWPVIRYAFIGILTAITCASLIYPAIAIPTRIGMVSRPPTLDGIEYIKAQNPSDYAAIKWLQENASADSVLLEAVGGSYSYYARFSSTTGLQTLIGWPGHESQWRGPLYSKLAGNREALVKELYGSANLERTRELIAQFNIKYVVVGSLERDLSFSTHVGLEKFARYFPVVFQEGDTTIYQVDSLKGQETP